MTSRPRSPFLPLARSPLLPLALVVVGQIIMAQPDLLGGGISLAHALNARFHLGLPNPGSTLLGIPFLLAGGWLFARQSPPRTPKKNPKKQKEKKLRVLRGSKILAALAFALFVYLLAQLWAQNAAPTTVILWLLVVLALTALLWQRDRGEGVLPSLALTPADTRWLLALLIIGFAAGAYRLLDLPLHIFEDEAGFWHTARGLVRGDFRLSFFDYGLYTFPIASSYFQAGVMRMFGQGLWGWRFSAVLPAVLAVVPLYLLVRDAFGRRLAAAAGLVLLTNGVFLAFARLGYNNSQALLPVTLTVYLFALSVRDAKDGKNGALAPWLAGLAAGLGFYTYLSGMLGAGVILLGIIYLAFTRRLRWRQIIVLGAGIYAGWAVIVLPRVVFGLASPRASAFLYKIWDVVFFNAYHGRTFFSDAELFHFAPPLEIVGQTLFFEPRIYLTLLAQGAVRTLLAFHNPFLAGQHFPVTHAAGPVAGVFYTLGLAVSLKRWRQARYGLPLLWFGAGLLGLSVLTSAPPNYPHMLPVLPALAIFCRRGDSRS